MAPIRISACIITNYKAVPDDCRQQWRPLSFYRFYHKNSHPNQTYRQYPGNRERVIQNLQLFILPEYGADPQDAEAAGPQDGRNGRIKGLPGAAQET